MRLSSVCVLAALSLLVGAQGCGGGAAGGSGVILYNSPAGGIRQYDFDAGRDAKLLEGQSPGRFANGDLVYVFQESFTAPYQIVMGDAAGTRRTKVLQPGPTVADYNPVPSPDGTLIAFTYYPRGFTPAIAAKDGTVVMKPDGTIVANLLGVFDPVWTPDGRIVAAGTVATPSAGPTNTPTAPGLYLSSPDFKTIARIDKDLAAPLQPAVSADGKTVAFVLASHIWTIGMDGSGLRQVTSGDKEESAPTFSPDGSQIACVAYGTYELASYAALAVVPADGDKTALANDGDVWPLDEDAKSSSTNGRVNASSRLTWYEP